MFDIRAAYIRAFTDRAEYIRLGEGNTAVLQSYDSLLNVISNDPRFRALTYLDLNQPKEKEND